MDLSAHESCEDGCIISHSERLTAIKVGLTPEEVHMLNDIHITSIETILFAVIQRENKP